MKKFVIKTILFFTPILILGIIVEISLRENTFSAKRNYIDSNADSIEVLILGSSQNFRAINPEFLTMRSAPLAHGESAINIDFKLFDRYFESFPELHTVILEVSYHTLDDFRGYKWNKNHLFHIYYNLNNYKDKPPFKDHFLLTSNFKEYSKKFFKSILNPEMQEYNRFGYPYKWLNKSRFANLNYNDSLIKKSSHTAYLNGRHFDEHIAYFDLNSERLDSLITVCNKRNIDVVLLSPPKYYLYNQAMNKRKLERRNSIFKKYMSHKRVHIWNFETKYEYETELFGNEDHMNSKGAEIFTKEINVLLEELESKK
ncbi:hypothetical protein [Constantimarinum furrinae]|uniref:DUF1574 domain-containing protein n=1 Tax=Constantimarinum furrinae TaxID=2562285 RepID=A0A7G8PQV4_9FLAO|nr:hypothetical protein [Constantimarinum furrinae]QNJ96720.1 hypothetical protein ALE3EI_0129 [Constantimarinum furrinae]